MNLKLIEVLSSSGRYEECLVACQQFLDKEPENPSGWKYAGKTLMSLGKFDKAQEYLKKAHQIDNTDTETVKDIGNIFLAIGNKERASQWYKKALEINGNYAPALNNLANLSRQSGNVEESINLFKQAIREDPQLVQAYIGAATSLLTKGDIAEAELLAIQALKIDKSTYGANEILALILQKKNKPKQAISLYLKEIEVNPKAFNSHLQLGILLLQQEQPEIAVNSLLKALSIQHSDQCSLLLAQAYQKLGKVTEAINVYGTIDIRKFQNKLIHLNVGLCLLKAGENRAAVEEFKIAIMLDKDFTPAWENIGTALRNLGLHKDALSATQQALVLKPDNPDTLLNLGVIYKELGKLEQALASTLRSVELKPNNSKSHLNLGSIYKDLNQFEQALNCTLKSLELNPVNPTVHLNLGVIYHELGQYDKALESTLKALELKPDNATAYINLSGVQQDLGQYDKALRSSLKALELEPQNPKAYINLSVIYRKLGHLDKALASTLKAIKLKPQDPKIHLNQGSIYKDIGNLDKALISTLKSIELNPHEPIAHMNLGSIYKDVGDLDKALSSTLKSVELKNDNPTSYINLGNIYRDLGNENKAIEAYRKAYELEPSLKNACHANLHFSNIYQSVEEIDEAREDYIENLKSIFKSTQPKNFKDFLEFSLLMITYQNGTNDKDFIELIGEIVHPWLELDIPNNKKTGATYNASDKSDASSKLPKVGFYFDNPQSGHVIARHYKNLVKSCKVNGLEVFIIKGITALGKNCTELSKEASQTIQIPNNLEESVKMLRELSIDVLVYTEIHSSPAPYCLAHNRIAPVQIVLPGNAITTGLPSIDYFISSKSTECENSQKYYTEKLIRVKGIPTGFDEIARPNKIHDRKYFDLPVKSQILSLLHNPCKFHPEWDILLEELAQTCQDTIFLVSIRNDQPSQELIRRWERQATTLLAKSKFFDLQEKSEYLNLQYCSDAVLDPLHRGCGTTAYDVLAMGIPIVTKPGIQSRSRLTSGLYNIMNIEDAPIAKTNSEYISYCKGMLQANENWIKLNKLIRERYKCLLESNKSSIEEISNFIKAQAEHASVMGMR